MVENVSVNEIARSSTIEKVNRRAPVYLSLAAASLPLLFLAGLSVLSCQERHSIESEFGGLIVLSSILMYSIAKRGTGTLTSHALVPTRREVVKNDSTVRTPTAFAAGSFRTGKLLQSEHRRTHFRVNLALKTAPRTCFLIQKNGWCSTENFSS